MPLATGTAIALAAGMGAAGSVGGAALASSAAGSAANKQVAAANQAAQIERMNAVDALNFQKQQYATQQAQLAPYLSSGTTALANLDYLLGLPGAICKGATGCAPGAVAMRFGCTPGNTSPPAGGVP